MVVILEQPRTRHKRNPSCLKNYRERRKGNTDVFGLPYNLHSEMRGPSASYATPLRLLVKGTRHFLLAP